MEDGSENLEDHDNTERDKEDKTDSVRLQELELGVDSDRNDQDKPNRRAEEEHKAGHLLEARKILDLFLLLLGGILVAKLLGGSCLVL